MNRTRLRGPGLIGLAVLAAAVSIAGRRQTGTGTAATGLVPKTWDDVALASMDVPLAVASHSPTHVSSDYYYRIPVRKIYKQYPVYVPDKEPAGYIDALKTREFEEIRFDFDSFKTDAEWIAAGRVVFDAGIGFNQRWAGADVRDPGLWAHARVPTTPDGVVPFISYTIRQRGQVEIADAGCVLCHTRLMPDGTIVRGRKATTRPIGWSPTPGVYSGMPNRTRKHFSPACVSSSRVRSPCRG